MSDRTTVTLNALSSGWQRALAAMAIGLIGIAAAVLPHPSFARRADPVDVAAPMAPGVGMPGGPPTSADGLQTRIAVEPVGRDDVVVGGNALEERPVDVAHAAVIRKRQEVDVQRAPRPELSGRF